MYDSGPSDEELAAIGIRREDVEDTSDVEIWPENDLVFKVFRQASSQWRMGPAGRVALDHNIVFRYFDLMGIEPKEQLELMRDIHVLECAALKQMYKS